MSNIWSRRPLLKLAALIFLISFFSFRAVNAQAISGTANASQNDVLSPADQLRTCAYTDAKDRIEIVATTIRFIRPEVQLGGVWSAIALDCNSQISKTDLAKLTEDDKINLIYESMRKVILEDKIKASPIDSLYP